MLTLNFHSDAGHGWLAAPRVLLSELGILARVTPYSYQRGGTVYLEEDCDAGLLLQALRDRGTPFKVNELPQRRDVSAIRSYEHFSLAGPRRPLRVNDVIDVGPGPTRYQIHESAGPRRGWIVRRLEDDEMFRMPSKVAARAVLIEE